MVFILKRRTKYSMVDGFKGSYKSYISYYTRVQLAGYHVVIQRITSTVFSRCSGSDGSRSSEDGDVFDGFMIFGCCLFLPSIHDQCCGLSVRFPGRRTM